MPTRDYLRPAIFGASMLLVLTIAFETHTAHPVSASAKKPVIAPVHAAQVRPARSIMQDKTLAPINSGPGLIVCPPKSQDAALSDFGAGCGAWLQLQAAGQDALGQTPPGQA